MDVIIVVRDVATGAVNGWFSKGDWLDIAGFGFLSAVGARRTTTVAGGGVL